VVPDEQPANALQCAEQNKDQLALEPEGIAQERLSHFFAERKYVDNHDSRKERHPNG